MISFWAGRCAPRHNISYRIASVGLALGLSCLMLCALPSAANSQANTTPPAVGKSDTQLPRFVSLRASRVNLRRGPGTEYPIAWVYRRAGLPVEIIEEYEAWRRVRDAEGTTGWILRTLLSRRRTAIVRPWDVKPDQAAPTFNLKRRASTRSQPVVQLEAGVITDIQNCDGSWCFVSVSEFTGYLPQKDLWGVYSGEVFP